MRRAALVAVVALLAAGCGSSGSGDVASKSPRAILDATAAAIRQVHSYHVDGTEIDKDGRTHLVGDIAGTGAVRFRLESGAQVTSLVVAGGQTYIRGNAAFWRKQGGTSSPKVIKVLSDRWVVAPGGVSKDLKRSLNQLAPSTLAGCLGHNVGTLSKRGPTAFAGRQVVVLIDKGDKPGNEPGELYVAAKGPSLPVRVVQTGPRSPGGHLDPRCDDPTSTTTHADTRLSRFDEPVHIAPPADAVDLNTLFGNAPVS